MSLEGIKDRWLNFTAWLKEKPWRYRVAVTICLPTVIPVCLVIGIGAGLYAGIMNTINGIKAIIAGEPQ